MISHHLTTKEHSLSFHYFLDYVTTLPQLHRLQSVQWENEIGQCVGTVMAYFNVCIENMKTNI